MTKELKVGMLRVPARSVDTSSIATIWDYYILDQMTEQLLFSETDMYYTGIAEKWNISDDKLTYTFHLRKDAKFSDGSKITAEDVAFTLKRLILKSGLHWKISTYLTGSEKLKSVDDKISGIEIKDPHIIVLKLSKPYITLLRNISMTETGIIKRSQVDPKTLEIKSWEITSGAYTGTFINNEWVLKANSYSLKQSEEVVKNARLVQVNGLDDGIEKMKTGKLDVFIAGSNYDEKLLNIIKEGSMPCQFGDYATTEYIYLNINKMPFNNKNIRQTIMKKILESNTLNLKTELLSKADQIFLPFSPGKLDAKEIKKVLAGFKAIKAEKKAIVSLLQPTSFPEPVYWQTLKTIFEEINFELKMVKVSHKEFVEKLKTGDFDLYVNAISMTPSEMNAVLTYLYSQKTTPFHDITGKIIPLIKEASFSTKRDDEARINSKIALKLLENAEAIPVYYVRMPYFYKKDLDLSSIDNKDNDFRIWKLKYAK